MAQNRARFEEALERGHSYGWDQRWEEAIREFEKALKEFSNEPAPYAGLGMAFYELKRYEPALENYKKAARLSQGDIMYLQRVAQLQEQLKRHKDAAQTYLAIGEVQLRRRLLEEAVENWNRAVFLDADALRGHQRLAQVFQRQGVVPAAVREYLAIARILQSQGEADKAMQACQAAMQLDSRDADVLTALELLRQGESLAAHFSRETPSTPPSTGRNMTSFLEEAVPSGPNDGSSPAQEAQRIAMERLAEVFFGDDDEDESLTATMKDALIVQALDFQTRGMANEAISAYEKAIESGARDMAVHYNLGLLYQDKLRFSDAIAQFEIAVQDTDYRLGSHFALGECYRARGHIEKALEHFVTVLRIVDLRTVKRDQADRLIELYENLTHSFRTKGEPERATAFANTLVEFLSHKGWEDKVKEARRRLDTISSDRTMILGDIITAGSEHVLESLYLSQEYAKRGMYNAAAEEAYRAIQLSPSYLPAHLQLGDLLVHQKRNEAAALKYTAIGDTFRARGDLNGAIHAYERVIEIAPLDLVSRARLIDLLKSMGDFDRALDNYLSMGNMYYQLAQVDKARATFQEALNLAQRGTPEKNWKLRMLNQVADIDMQRLDWQRSLLSYKELRRLAPDDERIAITLIDLYYKVNQPKSALKELNDYMIQLIKGGKSAKVVGILEDMVKQRPNDPNLNDMLAKLYVQQKRPQKAIDLLDRLGESQLEAGSIEQAVATIEKILTLNPQNSASYRQLITQLRQSLA
ncbi:MAG: tetratricopeptide repeat protein [Chloroflexi bacterium]|nr:tetratricopeptide repeat protein [Chloroflexota bacterium]MBP8057217.1 tetratricopeptide repeat protein [Chloroflexota bacterium]